MRENKDVRALLLLLSDCASMEVMRHECSSVRQVMQSCSVESVLYTFTLKHTLSVCQSLTHIKIHQWEAVVQEVLGNISQSNHNFMNSFLLFIRFCKCPNLCTVLYFQDTDIVKVGVANLINHWVKGSPEGGNRHSPSTPSVSLLMNLGNINHWAGEFNVFDPWWNTNSDRNKVKIQIVIK